MPFVVEQGENDEPIIHQPDWSSPTLAIGIPYDLSHLLRENPEIGREWYEAARASFIPAFESGYVAVDFVRQEGRCWYVLQQMSD